MGCLLTVPKKLSEEAQKAEEAVDVAGKGQEKRPDKAPETGEASGAAGQCQDRPPGEASETGEATGAAGGRQPMTRAFLSRAATIKPLSEESIEMVRYEMEKSHKKNRSSQSPPTSPVKFSFGEKKL